MNILLTCLSFILFLTPCLRAQATGRYPLAQTGGADSLQEAPAFIILPDTAAAPGDILELPIRLVNAAALHQQTISAIFSALRFNKTLLEPLLPTAFGTLNGKERITPFVIPVLTNNDTTIFLRMRATLGNDTACSLLLDSIFVLSTFPPSITFQVLQGHFHLNTCEAGGARLYKQSQALTLFQNHPNPATGSTMITYDVRETGHTRLLLTNALGQVYIVADGMVGAGQHTLEVNTSTLCSGVYTVLLETPGGTATMNMLVEK